MIRDQLKSDESDADARGMMLRIVARLGLGLVLLIGVGAGAIVEALDHDPPPVYVLHRSDSSGPRVTCDPDTLVCTDGRVVDSVGRFVSAV